MSRLLVLGVGPLPFEDRKKVYGSSLRTWHFTKPLLDDGHEILLVAMQLPDPYHEENLPQIFKIDKGPLTYYSVNELYVFMDMNYLQAHCDQFQPDAIIGINSHASAQACKLKTNAPIWADLNGWVMAEAQAKAARVQDDSCLPYFWGQEEPVIKRADKISVVSEPQKFALLGELATTGRLIKETFGYEFTDIIPNAVNPEDPLIKKTPLLRNKSVTEKDFLVLWSGGYNTWTDIQTLFKGLTLAMEKDACIQFVSTGGAISGHDDKTYPDFLKLIEDSPLKNRFHMLGWLPTADIPTLYSECDLGLNIDGLNYEVIFGARNRINGMVRMGLPVLTTTGTEVADQMLKAETLYSFTRGNPQDLAEKILWASTHREETRVMGNKAKEFVLTHWTYAKTTENLRNWAKAPTHAPDWGIERPSLNNRYRLVPPKPEPVHRGGFHE
jgi:glycosyltransferase involved in cell wall biosynthesis